MPVQISFSCKAYLMNLFHHSFMPVKNELICLIGSTSTCDEACVLGIHYPSSRVGNL